MTIQTTTMPRRLGALLLCLALCLGMLPASALAAGHDGFTYEETTDQISGITRTYRGGSGDNLALDISTPGISKIEFKVNDTLTVNNSINITASISLTEIVFSSGNVLVGGDITAPTQIIINGGYVKASNIKAVGRNVSGDTSAVSITGGIVEVTGEISSVAQNQQSSSTVTINGNTVVFAGSIKNNNTDVTPTQGVVFVGDTGKVYGSVSLPGDIEIPEGYTLTVPSGTSLTIPAGTTLTNNGTISIQGNLTNNGTLLNNGTITGTVSGNQPTYSSKVTVSFSQNGQTVSSVPYGSTVTITATMEKAETAANALEVDPGMVGFYLGEDTQSGILVGTDDVEIVNGVYTAAVDVTLDGEKGVTKVGAITITAVFGGYAPDGDEDGDSLAPNTGSAQLTVVESYSIDYEDETITVADGYSLYVEETGGTAIFTSSGENNTTSLTNYIQNSERDLYLQAPNTGGAEQPNRREITIPARPQAPSNTPTINYSEEKLNFPPVVTKTTLEYALSQSDPNWQDVPSGAALSEMEWDGKAEKSYYFRTGATDTSFASSATTTPIVAPARPTKPADPTAVEVTSNSITIQVVSGQEYRLGSSGDWSTLTGTTGSDGKTVYTYNNLDSGTQYTIATRTPADDNVKNQFASHPATVTVTTKYETELGGLTVSGNTGIAEGAFQYGDTIKIVFTPERKTETNTNSLAENTATLTYTPDEGEEVTLATATAQADGSFELTYDTKEKKLPIGESLTLTVSYGGSGALNPVEKELTVTLEQAILKNMPTVTGSFVYGETLTVNYTKQDDESVTYQWYRGGEKISDATENSYTLTAEDISKNIYVIVSATDEWHRGAMQSRQQEVAKAQGSIEIACESVTYGETVQPSVSSNTNEGANVTYSYVGTDGTSYGPSNEAPENAGTYTVTATVAETATHTAATSEPVAFTIEAPPAPPYTPPKPTGPSTGTSDGWEDIQEEIGGAEKCDTITIDMGDETEVPGEIFEEVAGKDVTVEIDLGGGVSWTVNGEDIPTGTDFSDLDLGVSMNTKGIDVDVINTVTDELGSVQITLAHDGAFGFALTLTAPLGKENAGYWANLYHYDEDAETLDYETSAEIASDGSASLRMTHASQYAIVIDEKSHDLPFTDLGENQWYESAVRYAYTHGIMQGTSATTFVPGKSLTRAEAVQVLYNLEGQPEGSGSTTFPDLVHDWYKPAIAWAEQTSVVDGYEDGTFRPDEPVTRQEFAQMLYNYAQYKGYDLTAKGDLTAFPDGDQVQDWALPAMTWANGNELINGHDDGTLEPGGTTTRAQAASILMRFDQKLVE